MVEWRIRTVMNSLEALNKIKDFKIKFPDADVFYYPLETDYYKEAFEQLEKDLELLDLYKKFFKYYLTEIQMIKYLVLPNSGDIRRPDTLIKITDEEYEILKEGLEK